MLKNYKKERFLSYILEYNLNKLYNIKKEEKEGFMYKIRRSNGTIIAKGKARALSKELNKHRIITPEFINNCRKERTNISANAMYEMDRLFNESRK